jgi:hypothetical protein
MGGVEVNCLIRLSFEPNIVGEVRLSRDWPRPNHLYIECRHGWISWEIHQAESLKIKYKQTGYVLDGKLQIDEYIQNAVGYRPRQGKPEYIPTSLEQSFTRQLVNLAAAIRGQEPLFISAEQGLISLSLIETCYRQRQLVELPWLTGKEYERARTLALRRSGA